jgi:hypothetical protein
VAHVAAKTQNRQRTGYARAAWKRREPAGSAKQRMQHTDAGQIRRERHGEMTVAEILFLMAVVIYLFGEDMARRSRV